MNTPHTGIRCGVTRRFVSVLVCASLAAGAAAVRAQQLPLPPDVTAEEGKAYQAFFSWYFAQPPEVQREADASIYRRYSNVLEAAGASRERAADTIKLIELV